MIRVVIADDHDLVREGVRLILGSEEGIEVCGEAGSGRDALELVRRVKPDVVLMDIRMPGMDGLEATRRVVESGAARVIVLTTFDVDEYVYEALRAGASGFLLKSTPPADLVAAVRAVGAGGEMLSPEVVRRLVGHYVRRPDPSERDRRLAELSERELDILRLIARGRSNAEIAADLHISVPTVKTHVTRVLAKLGARDRVQAVIAAYELGFVEAGDGRV